MYNKKTTSSTMKVEPELVSLYDFLGHAAGQELGARVYEVAKFNKVRMTEKHVITKTYTGKVMMYPVPFLTEYFGNLAKFEPQSNIAQDDELPF
jgi:hypothetical protein